MRAISLVKRIEFEFSGNVVRNALTLGDVDNDGCNELIVGNQNGEVAIFKGEERIQTISKLSFVSCVAVGDIFNENRNSLVVVTADGWCFVYAAPEVPVDSADVIEVDEGIEQTDGQIQSTSASGSVETLVSDTSKQAKKDDKFQLLCVHKQRIPANAKNILLGDVDGDGMIEMVLGLTDRVVRSYRWINNSNKSTADIAMDADLSFEYKALGKFTALNKWECANQIGSITLHHSFDGKASLLIAQPGGTFMRIRCSTEESINLSGVENSAPSNSSGSQGETIPGSVDYQFLGISRMRNQNISTEILGDLKCSLNDSYASTSTQKSDSSKSAVKGRPYAVATLDGTIMAIAVDHQIFALTKLDVTGNGCDDIVVCSWDGQTYILDQEKNSVRFHLDQPVQGFASGYYNVKPDKPAVTCLVYVTFKNTVILYYDIALKEFICKNFEPDPELLSELFVRDGKTPQEAMEIVTGMDKKTKKRTCRISLIPCKTLRQFIQIFI
ncbi:hypothetical protein NQ315_004117 [Exocentrus adspersus]|uniref:Uncharacterized protein n=1 Tax=Exocentrus adspersus TaxID=1586481 RepID=A0AAV8W781_9CUCU|nr:hypothetical protein NQ315_004117 [Exocentrus adspersus]